MNVIALFVCFVCYIMCLLSLINLKYVLICLICYDYLLSHKLKNKMSDNNDVKTMMENIIQSQNESLS